MFLAKKADQVNLVWWHGTGLCLMAKKLKSGAFSFPSVHYGVTGVTFG
ncbi:IS66 family insertion sequence element accessory protein TnpB (plasmid) [Polymorphobacter sp. PAMC 29334]|nr:IS66 family insertion sequence element accessory protein TnpB [Polymorphobacter sp. PAMC 29334]QYE33198.1 IS66 family insertion sequence element accessory protein TnpB [Polymorphobacter sp. PAMC 29334]